MSLTSRIQSAVDLAFSSLSDLVGSYTLQRTTEVFNPATSEVTTTVVTYIGTGLEDRAVGSLTSRFSDRPAIFSTIESGQIRIWLKIDQEPQLTDKIIFPDNESYSIVRVTPVKTYNTVFLYELVVTRG